jgi:ketosteroid isomerase-like protein
VDGRDKPGHDEREIIIVPLSVRTPLVRPWIVHHQSIRRRRAMNMQDSKTSDEARIRTLIEQRAKALHARNAEGVIACRTADYRQFSLAPPLAHSSDANNLNAWFATWQGPIGSEARDLQIVVSGDAAFSHGLSRMTGTKTDGEKVDLWFRETLGFRKVGGAWKIAHEHSSVPFYMDGSFGAAIDLKP